MRYEMMFPDQIRKAIKGSWPVIIPVGVLEYHAEHCVVGVDTLLVIKAIELLEKEMDMIILPPFYYGAASYVVEAPENNGTVQIGPDVINPFAGELFKSLLRIGFRNIHVFIHHQTENFKAGMPTDLAFKLAARQGIFDFLEKERGEGWWGDNSMQSYYDEHKAGADPFNWIKLHPFMDEETQKKYPIDHAGRQETSLMMAFCPEGIDMSKLSKKKWYCRHSQKANLKYGNAAKKMILNRMRDILKV
ncbi:MAG: Creatinine amidohydrolase [Syntrophomonadaceae bacterium]|nr:Creatinine amidohydrolase [Bacillota bacterium]MBT9147002.1 Creatinine amidohydrolase [Bacillota bacterium]